ncbi:MAG TPA: hypothetical protein VM253_04775 [Candidatus Limnocylindrales bacterium]|nr:hypothetical protein [Candidatus Limnocylindrales bacterium]
MRQAEAGGRPVRVRLVAAQPQHLRSGVAGQKAVAGGFERCVETAQRVGQQVALRDGGRVVPQLRRAHHAVLRVECHEAVLLSRNRDTEDLGGPRRIENPAHRLAQRHEPVLRVLLARPVGPTVERVGRAADGDRRALGGIEEKRLRGLRAAVDAEIAGLRLVGHDGGIGSRAVVGLS